MPYKDPERAREYRRQHYLKNKARYNQQAKEWYRENKEEAVRRAVENRSARPDYRDNLDRNKLGERNRRFYEKNKEDPEFQRKRRNHARRRRYGIRIATRDKESVDAYTKILEGDPCVYCGEQSNTIDHIQPISRGGIHAWENTTASCRRCNSSKHTKDLLHFLLKRSLLEPEKLTPMTGPGPFQNPKR